MARAFSHHPVLRNGGFLLLTVAAVGLLAVSALVNVHSVPWLLAIYTTSAFLIVAIRLPAGTAVRGPFVLYSVVLCLYLFNVWCLHIVVPSGKLASEKAHVDFMARFVCLGMVCVPVAVFSFALRISETRARLLQWIEVAGWLGVAFFYSASLAGRFVEDWLWTGTVWTPTLGGLYKAFSVFALVYALLGWAVPLARVFVEPSRQRRLRLIYYLLGFIPFSLACLSLFLISRLPGLYPIGGILFLVHFAILAYAVFRHQLYDVTIVLRRSLAYAGISLMLGMLYGGLLWASGRLIERSGTARMLLPPLFFVVLAGFLYAPLLGLLQRWVDRLFLRGEVNRQTLLEAYAAEISGAIQLGGVASSLCQVLHRGLAPRCVGLYLFDPQGRLTLSGRYTNAFECPAGEAAEELPAALKIFLAHAPGGPRVIHVPEQSATPAALAISEGDERLVIPLRHREETLGYVVLEPKRADEPYSPDDQRFAEAVASQSAVALLNARAFARIQHLQELNQRTLEGLTAGVLLLTRGGGLVLWNEAARRMVTGADGAASAVPATLREVGALRPQLARTLEEALADGKVRENVELSLEAPRRLFLLVSVRSLAGADGEPLFLVLLHDLTAYKEMEATARRNESLAKVGEMISAINHEIGNIVQPIRTQLHKLESGTPSGEVLAGALPILKNRVDALERLLEGLKDLARPIELRVRPVDLADLAESVLSDLREMPLAKGVSFRVDVAADARTCPADGQWLRQVLYNLVRNAAEAAAGASSPAVRITASPRDGMICLEVSDNGPGIAPQIRARLFEPFASTKGGAGTGLGLSISRRIVELHGGRIEAHSEAGAGACFLIHLPQRRLPVSGV